ncbi:hypothetical protein CSAL01_09687 [Colletotrichum salicis]|uniref:Uncharacterized protein n=1 Tax=Colletotrichum salicis TaxID=1209931 RepID=A0A135UIZ4_9PEZI|nr:hypothetical protein CSAL01_09687 [Colletotrichum salicis]
MRNLTTQKTLIQKAHGTRVSPALPALPALPAPIHHITPPPEELLKTILRPGAQSSRPKLAWRSLITARAVRRHSQTSTESESCPHCPPSLSLIHTKAQIQLSYLPSALEKVGFPCRALQGEVCLPLVIEAMLREWSDVWNGCK